MCGCVADNNDDVTSSPFILFILSKLPLFLILKFQVAKQLKKSTISASELCDASLKQIEKTKSLNAFITVTSETAREQAKESDQRFSKGNISKCLSVILRIKF